MKERIEAKIQEIIEYILLKDAKNISYSEYQTLESRLGNLRIEEACNNNLMFNTCCCATSEEIEKLKEEENKNE